VGAETVSELLSLADGLIVGTGEAARRRATACRSRAGGEAGCRGSSPLASSAPSCSSAVAPRCPRPARLAALELELGSLFLVGFHGTDAEGSADLERLLCDVRVGGIVLFAATSSTRSSSRA